MYKSEQVVKLEQEIRKLQTKKKRLLKEEEEKERKKRDHALIVVGATVVSMFSVEEKNGIYNSNDDDILEWVFNNIEVKSK